jgi:hypothetical protein
MADTRKSTAAYYQSGNLQGGPSGQAIPASVISTFGMMRALDFTLNSVTLLDKPL